jgi:RHS repeat-associated protein
LDDAFDSAGNRRSSNPRTHDAAGNLTTTTTTFVVNLLDQVIREDRADGSVAKTTYDAAGNGADRCVWNPGTTVGDCLAVGTNPWPNQPSQATSTTSDALNQRVVLVDAQATTTTTYDPDHNYQVDNTYLPLGNGREHQTLRDYDGEHRLTATTFQTCSVAGSHSCTDTPLLTGRDLYSYDDNDNRTRVQEDNGGGAGLSDWRYCYDARDQLVSRKTAASCSPTSGDERYAYDDAGNRTQVITGTTTNYTYDAEGRLTAAGSQALTYDDAGRLQTDGSWIYSYDGEGRLVEVCDLACTGASNRYLFTYDADGRRTKIEDVLGLTSTVTEIRYSGDRPVAEVTDGVVTKEYVTDESGTIVKIVIPAGQPNAGAYLVNWNGHGDALNLLGINADGTTTLANSFTYSTWGEPDTSTHNGIGDVGFRYLYGGQHGVQWDAGIDLHLMGARHYSPALGRFIQPDPPALEENLYAYVNNSPITRLDPDGTFDFRRQHGGGSRGGAGGGPGQLFSRMGVKITPEFRARLGQRRPRGVTERRAQQTYCSGRLFHDPASGHYVRYSPTTSVVVVTSRPSRGTAITTFTTKKPNSRWNPVRWRRGC